MNKRIFVNSKSFWKVFGAKFYSIKEVCAWHSIDQTNKHTCDIPGLVQQKRKKRGVKNSNKKAVLKM